MAEALNPASAPVRRRRRWRRRVVLLASCGLAFGAVSGCTATITPPDAVQDPVTVFLLREALHTGVVLPGPRTGDPYVEFGFGDWAWFALAEDAWYDVFATVLWPTQGALGRREFPAQTAGAMASAAPWAELQPVLVERARATQLFERLQQTFDAGLIQRVDRRDLRFQFVPFARDYWFPNNCADLAAEWFTELDCEVGWLPIRAGLSVSNP